MILLTAYAFKNFSNKCVLHYTEPNHITENGRPTDCSCSFLFEPQVETQKNIQNNVILFSHRFSNGGINRIHLKHALTVVMFRRQKGGFKGRSFEDHLALLSF